MRSFVLGLILSCYVHADPAPTSLTSATDVPMPAAPTASVAPSSPAAPAALTPLSKQQAQDWLEKNGFRWAQTFAPIADADAKFGQADAASKIRYNAFSREFIMRTNELLLGIADNPLQTIGGGITGIQMNYEIWNQSTKSKIEAARINRDLGRAQAAQYQNDLRFLLQLRYLNAQQYQMRSKVADLLLQKDASLSKLAQQKVAAGVGIPLDLARSEALVEKDKFKKLDADANYQKALNEIAELLPDLPLENVQLETLQFQPVPTALMESLAKKSAERPEVKVANLSMQAMQKLKEEADNESKPTISMVAEVGTVGTQALGLINSPTGSVGLQLNIPLSNGGYHEAKAAEALGKLQSVQLQEKQVMLETKNQLATAKMQLEYAEKVVQASLRQIDFTRKAMEYAERKIKIGSAGGLDMINAQNDLAMALEMNVQALFSFEAAKLQFFHLISDLDDYFSMSSTTGAKNE